MSNKSIALSKTCYVHIHCSVFDKVASTEINNLQPIRNFQIVCLELPFNVTCHGKERRLTWFEVDVRRSQVVEFLLRPFLANTKSVKALFTSSLEYLVIGLALSSLSAVNSGSPREIKQQNHLHWPREGYQLHQQH